MKKILYFFLFLVSTNISWGQNPTPGVTVIVHGFDALGGVNSGISSWQAHAIALREFATKKTGRNATVFVNDKKTGFWTILEKDGSKYRQSNAQTYDPLGELIFVYDWTALSNDGMGDLGGASTGVGSLESAADNLFAMLIQPVVSVTKPLSNQQPIYSNVPAQLLRAKQTHFIGHSRGTVVLLQVLNRLYKYFPDVTIEHLTTLDPHPATKMGDIESSLNVVSQSLPYIFGTATGCNTTSKLCGTNSNIYYALPENVIKADNYFRQGTRYEPIFDWFTIGEFSGVNIPNASHNRQLNNAMIANNADNFGGAHSEVHNWYWGTFDRQFFYLGQTFTNDKGKNTNVPLITVKNNDWYFSGNIGVNFTFEGYENIGSNNPIIKSGFYYSRLGGHYDLLPTVNGQSTDNSNKRPIKTPFNNELNNFSPSQGIVINSYFPGWEFNGGRTDGVSFTNGIANFIGGSYLKHSLYYIPLNATKLKIVAKKGIITGSTDRKSVV